MLLRSAVGMAAPQATVPALGAAELVGAALEAFATDPESAGRRARPDRLLLVDDAQHLDPQAARLVRVLAGGADSTVLAGDPNQAVFGFRGADPAPAGGRRVRRSMLTESHRCAAADRAGRQRHRAAAAGADERRRAASPAPTARRLGGGAHGGVGSTPKPRWSPTRCAARISSTACRGRRWRSSCGRCRGPGAALRAGAGCRGRAGGTAGVDGAAGRPAGGAGAADGRWTPPRDGLTATQALALLTGPIGRVDPVSLRQLRRALRRADGRCRPASSATCWSSARRRAARRACPPTGAPAAPGARRAGRRAAASAAADPRSTLWQAWHRPVCSAAGSRPASAAARPGVQADRDLDAVTALFDVADQYVSRTPGASLRGLLDHVAHWASPPGARDDRCRRRRRCTVAQRACGARPGMGRRGDRGAAGRVVAQQRFRAAACWAPSDWSTSSTVCPSDGQCRPGRRWWPTSGGC